MFADKRFFIFFILCCKLIFDIIVYTYPHILPGKECKMIPLTQIKDFLTSNHIEYYSAIPLTSCIITKPYLLEKHGIEKDGSVLLMLAPYFSGYTNENLSLYAVPRDYHIYFENLFTPLCELLRAVFPHRKFVGFCDHSPINEVHAAAVGGLGFIGDNRLLINEKYSSFVFIGGVFSDLPAHHYAEISRDPHEVNECLHCGLCADVCPNHEMCLSSVTQKKGRLDDAEIRLIAENNSVWGCDLCQTVCPMVSPAMTEIDFFKRDLIPCLTEEIIFAMSDNEFSSRAFSWRGRETILRNLRFFTKHN